MTVKKISLRDFRNYKEAEVGFDAGINVIWGRNGQGKTNLLEALHILSVTKSMRPGREQEWIRFGESQSQISASVTDSVGVESELEISLFREKPRRLTQDGAVIYGARDWMGCLPVVFFGPQELELVRDGPAYRRRFMDITLCQLYPSYTGALSAYKRTLEHKRKILKEQYDKPSLVEVLPDFNLKLAQNGAAVVKTRARHIKMLNERAAVHHANISGQKEALELRYKPDIDYQDSGGDDDRDQLESRMLEVFTKRQPQELRAGTVMTGPHRDDIFIGINGADARLYASQGQTKTAALACKLAERDMLESVMGESPVLLLDDVLSELDDLRRDYLLHRHQGGQCLMTDCRPERLENLCAGKTIHVEDGAVCTSGWIKS